MTLLNRRNTWATTQQFDMPTLNDEFNNIINIWNQHDQGLAKWQQVAVSGNITVDGNMTTAGALISTLTSNQIILGTTRTLTITAPTPASSSRTWTIPDISGAGTFAALEGTQTFSGSKTFSSAVNVTATSNHLVLSTSSNTLTLSAAAQATSARTWTVPDITGNGTFAALEGTQTFSGTKTFSSFVTITGDNLAQFNLLINEASSSNIGIDITNSTNSVAAGAWLRLKNGGASGGDPFVRFDGSSQDYYAGIDQSASQNFVVGQGLTPGSSDDIVISQSNGAVTIRGTNTNNSASSGFVGEYVESVTSSNLNAAATNTFDDLVSISLTAGDWDVSGTIWWDIGTATWSACLIGISSTTGNSSTGLSTGVNRLDATFANSAATPLDIPLTIPTYRVSLSSTTTYYLKRRATYTAGTPVTQGGRISARRVR